MLAHYKTISLPEHQIRLGPGIGTPGLDMVNVLDLLGLREKLGMGHDVVSHYSLILLADIIKVFRVMHYK